MQPWKMGSYSDLALDPDLELFVKPDLNGGMLLEELENEVDWGKEDFSSTSTASAATTHDKLLLIRLEIERKGMKRTS